jgi:hypothetical protein
MVVFISVMTQLEGLLIFMALLPVIWIYSFFDSVQQLNKKQRGEELIDRTVLEDFEERRESGKKSKAVATLFAIFPGAGHLYLGLQKRGIQLMAGFLFAIYILDLLRLGFFFFLIPIIWFYSFFDGLQKASKMEEGPVEDTPIISGIVNHQKWVGFGLVGLGIYFLASNIIIPAIAPHLDEWIGSNLEYWFRDYFQKGLVCILLIGGGIKLLSGSKKESRGGDKIEHGESERFLGISWWFGFCFTRFSNFGYEFDDDSAIMVAVAVHDLGYRNSLLYLFFQKRKFFCKI